MARQQLDGRVPVRGGLLRREIHRVVRTNDDGDVAAVGSRPGAVAAPQRQSRGFVARRGQRGWNIHARVRRVRGGVLSRARRRELVVEARGRAATRGRGHRGGAGEPVERHGAHARGGRGRIAGIARDEHNQQRHQALDAEHHQARQHIRPVLRESHRKRGLRQGTRGAGRSGGGRVRVRPGRRRRRHSCARKARR